MNRREIFTAALGGAGLFAAKRLDPDPPNIEAIHIHGDGAVISNVRMDVANPPQAMIQVHGGRDHAVQGVRMMRGRS